MSRASAMIDVSVSLFGNTSPGKEHTIVIIVIVMIIIVVVVVVVIMVPVILGDASSAQRDLGLGRFPFTDAVELGPVLVIAIALRSLSHDWTAGIPAHVGNIVVLELGCHGKLAGEHEAGESENLRGTHGDLESER